MSEVDSILLHLLHIRCKSWLYITVDCIMEERGSKEKKEKKETKERKEKRRENEQKAISTTSQATDAHR